MCSYASCNDYGHDCAIAGGEELTALVARLVRGRDSLRGERGSVEELTAGASVISACSGMAW